MVADPDVYDTDLTFKRKTDPDPQPCLKPYDLNISLLKTVLVYFPYKTHLNRFKSYTLSNLCRNRILY